jgi:23S rRNA (cytosine1962-C5)-methyltransferase
MFLLDAVPAPSSRRLAVRVTNDAIRQIRGGHPWVFDGSIVSVNHSDGAPGDFAVIFDGDRQFVAIGLYDPKSPIRVRILHHAKPTTIDAAFWAAKVSAAIERRKPVLAAGDTTGYRVVHGENDGLSGLVLDRYGDTFVLKLYTAAWLPHLATLVPVLQEQLDPTSLVVRFSRDVAGQQLFGLREGMALIGDKRPVISWISARIAPSSVRWPRTSASSTSSPAPVDSASSLPLVAPPRCTAWT